jgi:hypothetical protein
MAYNYIIFKYAEIRDEWGLAKHSYQKVKFVDN